MNCEICKDEGKITRYGTLQPKNAKIVREYPYYTYCDCEIGSRLKNALLKEIRNEDGKQDKRKST